MGSEQFSVPVRGSGDDPVSVSNRGSLDTNDYPEGDAAEISAYPHSINPPEVVKELGFTKVGSRIDVKITTTSGTSFTLLLESNFTFDRWDIDSVELQDPNNNTPTVAYFWAGE